MWLKGVNVTSAKLSDGSKVFYYYTSRKNGIRFWPPVGKQCNVDYRKTGPFPNGFHPAYLKAISDRTEYAGDIARFIATFLDPNLNAHLPKSKERMVEIGRYLRIVNESFGTLSAKAAAAPRFRGVLRKWQQKHFGHSARQADLAIGAFSQVLQMAVDDGELDRNQAQGFRRLYKAPNDKVAIPAQDIERFMATAKPHVCDALQLALFTGLRAKDLSMISWSADKENHIQVGTSKRSRTARIPITAEARMFLDRLKANQIRNHSLQLTMLVGERGRPMRAKTVTRMISDAFKAIELPHTAHRARNTYATILKKAGFSIEDIAMIMGWSVSDTEEMIKIYVDLDDVIAASITRLENGTKTESAK